MSAERLSRRRLLRDAIAGLAVAAGVPALLRAQTPAAKTPGVKKAAKPNLAVYKDAQCGCCQSWVEHMKLNGYTATVTNADMDFIKREHKIPAALGSCHTTLVGGYLIEGHVPAPDVDKLLTLKPANVRGLTIPGMPKSAPGMDLTPFEPYTVLTFDAAGKTAIFARHDKA
ncbi:MAG TPA: DUF411 domain-containing protein [Vicinamibacterales bacterium]|nr:DUF411 domain-containing protein [Vicinamibacterales bacterium]